MTLAESRRSAIRELLSNEEIKSQADLLRRLAQRGVRTTQPMLSRDLRALNVAKRSGIYQLVDEERVTPLESLRSLLRSAATAGHNLVVVRCEPGAASTVARALETEQSAGLVGTVAGDDTVFAAVATNAAGQRIKRRIAELL